MQLTRRAQGSVHLVEGKTAALLTRGGIGGREKPARLMAFVLLASLPGVLSLSATAQQQQQQKKPEQDADASPSDGVDALAEAIQSVPSFFAPRATASSVAMAADYRPAAHPSISIFCTR